MEEKINLKNVLEDVKSKLKNANKDDFSEAEWLVANVLGVKKFDLKFITTITKKQNTKIKKALKRRINGEPISKIFGFAEFYGLKFFVNKNVLSPRQETELLVENVLKTAKEDDDILDLCTGSGAIAVAIKKNKNAKVFASDISAKALKIAKFNAKNNNTEINFIKSNLFSNISQKFDIIVSNPPYIKTKDIKTLDEEVQKFDPILALDGGDDGLDFYKKIIKNAPKYLKQNGKIMFEIGFDQAKIVKNLLTDGFKDIKIIKDYNNNERIVIAEIK